MTWAQLSSTVIIALLSSISGQVFMVISHLESDLNMKTYIKNYVFKKMGTMGQNEKMPQRYFNHGLSKDEPKFWWYFRFFEIGSKVRTTISKRRFSNFVFRIFDS